MGHRGVIAVVGALALLGCGSDGDDDQVAAAGTEEVTEEATGELTERHDPDSPVNTLAVAIRYFRDAAGGGGGGASDTAGTPAASVDDLFEQSEAVVVGTLVSVDRGLAIDQGPAEDGQPNEGQTIVEWVDDTVDFRTIHVDLVADEVLKGDLAVGDPVPISLTAYPTVDPGLLADAIREVGDRVLVFLNHYPSHFEAERWRVGSAAELYARVGPDESVSMPFWPDDAAPSVRQSMETLDQVRAAATAG